MTSQSTPLTPNTVTCRDWGFNLWIWGNVLIVEHPQRQVLIECPPAPKRQSSSSSTPSVKLFSPVIAFSKQSHSASELGLLWVPWEEFGQKNYVEPFKLNYREKKCLLKVTMAFSGAWVSLNQSLLLLLFLCVWKNSHQIIHFKPFLIFFVLWIPLAV